MNNMVITYYGVSCFKIQAGETVLAFDPPSKGSEFKSPRFQTNAVLISHNHKDHNGYDNLAGKEENKGPVIINGPGEYEFSGIHIIGIKSFHDAVSGEKHGNNTIYAVKFEDITICHLGDFGENNLRPEIKEAIGKVDILLVPIGGDTVLDAQKAAKISSQLEAKVIIPMHYKSDSEIKKFLNEIGNGTVKPVDKLTIKKKDISDKNTQVVVLAPVV